MAPDSMIRSLDSHCAYRFIEHLAWLKKPASVAKVTLDELVALCSAAVRPTRGKWGAFLRNLRTLEKDGTLTSNEAAAAIASELTYRKLDDLNEEAGVDAATTIDIVEEVKAVLSAEADE